mmetsp:Transcript_48219/g.65477  ORF Transcript_48219/g.65477 Transcript_48219/m.65477 type:complete len:264 (-) Transcript_48219:78-869(-)
MVCGTGSKGLPCLDVPGTFPCNQRVVAPRALIAGARPSLVDACHVEASWPCAKRIPCTSASYICMTTAKANDGPAAHRPAELRGCSIAGITQPVRRQDESLGFASARLEPSETCANKGGEGPAHTMRWMSTSRCEASAISSSSLSELPRTPFTSIIMSLTTTAWCGLSLFQLSTSPSFTLFTLRNLEPVCAMSSPILFSAPVLLASLMRKSLVCLASGAGGLLSCFPSFSFGGNPGWEVLTGSTVTSWPQLSAQQNLNMSAAG